MTDTRSTKPFSELRLRMQADMLNRNFGAKTQHDYLRHVETFAKFLDRAPDTATGDDIRRFQTAEREAGAKPPKMNAQAAALRFFLGVTCGRLDLAQQIARTYLPPKLPSVLSGDDVARLLEAAPGPGLKYKAALSIAYGAGLRGGEVTMLRVSDAFAFGDAAAVGGAADDAFAFVLVEGGQKRDHALADGCGEVNVVAIEHLDFRAAVDDTLDDLDAVNHRAGGTVPFGQHQQIAGAERVDPFLELRSAGG
jgi:site-specific recombinase XerC